MAFLLDRWEIDSDTRRIACDGFETRVSPKAMGVLLALDAAWGGVVSRDTLLDTVWPGVTVGEEVLTQAIAELRRAFGDDRRQPSAIETVHKRGYRLLLKRDPMQPPQSEGGLGPARGPSVAVLPFRALGSDEAALTLADGLSRDVSVSLARTRWLFVSALASSSALAAGGSGPVQAAARLGVRYILDGTVIVDGRRFRLSVSLCDATDGGTVWAEIVERPLDDLFEIIDSVAGAVAMAVESEIVFSERRRAMLSPIESLDAWGAFHRGTALASASDPGRLEEAEALLLRATSLAPDAPRILAATSALYFRRTCLAIPETHRQDRAKAVEFAERAVASDARDPMALMARGMNHVVAGEVEAGRARYQDAIALNRNFAHARYYLAYTSIYADDFSAGLQQMDFAHRLSPVDPMRFSFLAARGQLHSLHGEVEEGADLADRALSEPNANFWNHCIAAWCAERAGRRDTAGRYAAALKAQRPDFRREDYFAIFQFSDTNRRAVETAFDGIGL